MNEQPGVAPRIPFPDGQYVMLTWDLPEGEFGDLTTALLRRAASFVELGEMPVALLTLAPELDVVSAEDRLRSAGYFSDHRLGLRNLYAEVAAMSDDLLASYGSGGEVLQEISSGLLESSGSATAAQRSNEAGDVLQVDRFRKDGTRWISDVRDTKERGVPGGRLITLFDGAGHAVRQWTSAAEFYFAWLDHVIGEEETFLINDSQLIGNFLWRYQRAHVTTAHVLHSTHLNPRDDSIYGRLTGSCLPMLKQADALDLLAVLTEKQGEDISQANLRTGAVSVVPPALAEKPVTQLQERDQNMGAFVGRLTPAKQAGHAVRALSRARHRNPRAMITVAGDGPEKESLEQLIAELQVGEAVHVETSCLSSREVFKETSFSVLSSKSEGFGLSIVESMAEGCIPIAYDVRYGPSDLITHGVNGYLVPADDINALSEAIYTVTTLDETALQQMRAAAIAQAARFTERAIAEKWSTELRAAQQRAEKDAAPHIAAVAKKVSLSEDRDVLISGKVFPEAPLGERPMFLSWMSRTGNNYGRVPLVSSFQEDGTLLFEATVPRIAVEFAFKKTLDLYVDVCGGQELRRSRLRAEPSLLPDAEVGLRPYITQKENLSIAVEPRDQHADLVPWIKDENRPAKVIQGRYSAQQAAADNMSDVRQALLAADVELAVIPSPGSYAQVMVIAEEDAQKVSEVLSALPSSEGWSVDVTTSLRVRSKLEETAVKDDIPLAFHPQRGLKAPSGLRLDTSLEQPVIQVWERLGEEVPRADGGEFVPGTLNIRRGHSRGLFTYLEPDQWQALQEQPSRTIELGAPLLTKVTEPIDVVYTWVDGADPNWQRRKAEALNQDFDPGAVNETALAASRFDNRDEIRYSLRSLEMYADWVRHIYIVTDQQVPWWLNTEHPRVTVVDHRDIFKDPSVLPTYNSHGIGAQLHRIPGISDKYLYLNDDVFFGRPTEPELFFTSNGLHKFFLSRNVLDISAPTSRDLPVTSAAKQGRQLIQERFGRTLSNKFLHAPHPQNKLVLQEMEEEYAEDFARVTASRVRHPDDYAFASLSHYYAYMRGKAVEGEIGYAYIGLSFHNVAEKLRRLLKRRDLDVFCLNDISAEPQQKEIIDHLVGEFLEERFPLRSSFEK